MSDERKRCAKTRQAINNAATLSFLVVASLAYGALFGLILARIARLIGAGR